MGRILPGDITKPFEARKARAIQRRGPFWERVGERALGSFLTPQGVTTGVKLVAPFIKMGGGEKGLTEESLGLSPAAQVAAQRVQPIPPGGQPPIADRAAIDSLTAGFLQDDKDEERALDAADRMNLITLKRKQREREASGREAASIDNLTQMMQQRDERVSEPVIPSETLKREYEAKYPVMPPGQLKREMYEREFAKGKERPDVVGKIYKVEDGSVFLRTQVRNRIIEIANKTGGDPSELLKSLIPESSMDTTEVNPDSGASGLIQFTDVALNEMKRNKLIPKDMKKSDIRKMGALAQLDLAEKYWLMHGARADYSKPGEYSVAIFGPVGLGKDRSKVLYKKGTENYRQNARVDALNPKDRKGHITVGDYLDFKMNRVEKFRKNVGQLPVFDDQQPALVPIPSLSDASTGEPETVTSGLEQETATIALPKKSYDDYTEEELDQISMRAIQRRMDRRKDEQALSEQPGTPADEQPASEAPEQEDQVWAEQARLTNKALAGEPRPSPEQEQSMLSALAKAGSFRDQQRYIEGALKRGDLSPDKVQALTMAAGLIRDRMQPRTLAEALYAAERGSTVGDLWYNRTMQGVQGRVPKSGSGLSLYQQWRIDSDKAGEEKESKERRRKEFSTDVKETRTGIRRIRDAYDKMRADKLIESKILTDYSNMLATIGKYEISMNKILREARNPNANIDELESRFAKVSDDLAGSKSRLKSILSESKNADKIAQYGAFDEVGSSDEEAARKAMGE